MDDLGSIPAIRMSGTEAFHDGGRPLGLTVLDYWRWGASDLVSNATRGVVAEFLVATAIGIADGVREEWSAYDLLSPEGIRLEIKASAYVQGWYQKQHSKPVFSCKPSRGWDRQTGLMSEEVKRQADVYVFCLHAHHDQRTLDVLDLSQWEFYVLPTRVLDARTRSQHSITLPSLNGLVQPVLHADLHAAILSAAQEQNAGTGVAESASTGGQATGETCA